MNIEEITLISFGLTEKELIDNLAGSVSRRFMIPVRIRIEHIDLSEYYNPSRRQYDGTALLKDIEQKYSSFNTKTMGLFAVDLFIPILTYIFGQAYLNGRSGIASVYRLNNELYGIEKNDKNLTDRFIKVVIHELGHMLGLKHCSEPLCVMRSSTYAEEIDQKPDDFCPECRVSISGNIKHCLTIR